MLKVTSDFLNQRLNMVVLLDYSSPLNLWISSSKCRKPIGFPSCVWAGGEVHPGQVASPSKGP